MHNRRTRKSDHDTNKGKSVNPSTSRSLADSQHTPLWAQSGILQRQLLQRSEQTRQKSPSQSSSQTTSSSANKFPAGPKLIGKYQTPDQAAIAVINEVNPRSIQQNVEYGGRIYMNPDGTFSYTEPNVGGAWGVKPGSHPPGTNLAGTYHTHAGPVGKAYQFSPGDLSGARADAVPDYLGTPTGAIKKYSPTGKRAKRSDFTIIQGPSSQAGDWGGYSHP